MVNICRVDTTCHKGTKNLRDPYAVAVMRSARRSHWSCPSFYIMINTLFTFYRMNE